MRSIKLFFLVLAGLVVFSLMLRVLLPVMLFVGAIGLGLFLIRKIGRAIRNEYHFHQAQGLPSTSGTTVSSGSLYFGREALTMIDIDEVHYVEVR